MYLNESATKRDQLRCLLSIGPADILHISDKRKFVKVGPRVLSSDGRMGHASGDSTGWNTRAIAPKGHRLSEEYILRHLWGTHVGCMPKDKRCTQRCHGDSLRFALRLVGVMIGEGPD